MSLLKFPNARNRSSLEKSPPQTLFPLSEETVIVKVSYGNMQAIVAAGQMQFQNKLMVNINVREADDDIIDSGMELSSQIAHLNLNSCAVSATLYQTAPHKLNTRNSKIDLYSCQRHLTINVHHLHRIYL